MRKIIISIIAIFGSLNLLAQNFSISLGTDIPYQHYLGANLELRKIEFEYRTGVLTPPYSDAILDIIQFLGTDDIYINLLDASFELGWTNSVGSYYKFGKNKNWYTGAEIRLDYLTAEDTPKDVIQTITGEQINDINTFFNRAQLKLGLKMIAAGLRLGKSFKLSPNNKHYLKTEISINKYITTKSILKLNGNNLQALNKELNKILWEDVFKKYGYVGGIGFAYSYKF